MFTIADLAYQNKMKNKKWLDLNMRPYDWVIYLYEEKNGVPEKAQQSDWASVSVCIWSYSYCQLAVHQFWTGIVRNT